MNKNVVLVSVLLLVLTGVQGLSLNDEIINTSDVENDSSTIDSSQLESPDLELETTEKYILFVDESDYRASVLQDLGVEIRYEYDIIDGVAVEIPPSLVDTVSQLDFVESVEPDRRISLPILEGKDSDNEAESYSGGDEQVIAILDTGIDNSHIDLSGEVVDNRDFTGSGPEDRHGHGTHVAGIASGTGEGNSEYVGVAPDTSLMNVKVLGDDGSGRASDAIRGIEYAVKNNADVIVMSLGVTTYCDGTDPLSQAADDAVEKGIPTIVAAGNEGPDSQTITSPGCGNQVLTVGASRNENIASFSSRGRTDDGRIKPDLVAPGANIYAAEAGTSSSYISKSGTSMSAPYVGGAVALMADENNGRPEEYFEALTDTAYSLNAGETSEGSGQINISAALGYWSNSDTPNSDSREDSDEKTAEEARKSAEREEGIRNVDENHSSETRNGKEYYVYDGETESGRKVRLWIDKETGSVDVRTNWTKTILSFLERIISSL